jgi:hypothetical protein
MNKNLHPLQPFKMAAIVAAALTLCPSAHAQTVNYAFGTQIDGPYDTTFQPVATFATLSVTTTDQLHYLFDLQALPSFNLLFGNPNASINKLVFNTNNMEPVAGSVRLASGGVWGVSNIHYALGDQQLGGITFEFTEGIGNLSDRLTAGERVVWETTFASPTSFQAPPFALKVYGFGISGTDHAWYVPASPVPEPETYGMLLAGLGMLGFAARRRKLKEVAAA